MKITVIGLTITSSWGNGHATTFRSLLKGLTQKGHDLLFLEKDVPYYAQHRDMPNPPFCRVELYNSLDQLKEQFQSEVAGSDLVIVGSYVPDGIATGQWVNSVAGGITAFYDIDTPVTMARLEADNCEYLSPELIPAYHLYLSFAGGPVLECIAEKYGSPCVKPLYCSVDTDLYYPEKIHKSWDIGYLGTYSPDRQPPLEELLIKTAYHYPGGKFVVAGPQYPHNVYWPQNMDHIKHLPPSEHRKFYNSQLFTLNITRKDMVKFGYSPSVRLFEAAACGIPVISDRWQGMQNFFVPDEEILLVSDCNEVLNILNTFTEEQREELGERARQKVLAKHGYTHRAMELENYVHQMKYEPAQNI